MLRLCSVCSTLILSPNIKFRLVDILAIAICHFIIPVLLVNPHPPILDKPLSMKTWQCSGRAKEEPGHFIVGERNAYEHG
jgi:hypothetical protein